MRTTVCPVCGYDLAGLPYPGTCPECGTGYDRSILVLSGVACGRKANLGNGKLEMGIWVLAGAATPACNLLIDGHRVVRTFGLFYLGGIACLALVARASFSCAAALLFERSDPNQILSAM